jgi:hypothetical protein
LVFLNPGLAQTIPGGGGGGAACTFANPTATAGPTAVNGTATTCPRSDSAPAVQKASNSQFGIMEGDGLTVGCTNTAGICNTLGQILAGTTQTITAAQWAPCSEFDVKTASQTLTLPLSSTLSANGCAFIKTIGQSVTLTPNASDAINGGTAGASITLPSGILASVTVDPATANNILVSPTVAGGGSGTVNSGTSGQMAYYASSAAAVSGNSNATISTGTLSLGASGTLGAVKMGNATSGTVTIQPTTGALGTATASLPANTGTVAELNLTQTFTAAQSDCQTTLTISSTTFTPDGSCNDFQITLTGSDTIANPSVTPVVATYGTFKVCQDATGSRTATWGSQFVEAASAGAPVLSTTASVCDYIPYRVLDATHILLASPLLNPSHQ